MRYRSDFEILGLPFVHVQTAWVDEEGRVRRGIAGGWIAFGDISFGILFSAGAFAFGGIAFGGIAIGALALAGLAMGGYSIGGLAIGWLAMGGLALGGHAALGGLALAKSFAVGGLAIAEHANDSAAERFFEQGPARVGQVVMDQSRWFLLLALIPILAAVVKLLRSRRSDGS